MHGEHLELLVGLATAGVVVALVAWAAFKVLAQTLKVIVPIAALLGFAVWAGVALEWADVELPSLNDVDVPTMEQLQEAADELLPQVEEQLKKMRAELEQEETPELEEADDVDDLDADLDTLLSDL